GKLRSGNFRFDVGTAGSVTLVLQTLMPILAFAPGGVHLEITGGTDVKWSPPIDYLRLVTLPILRKISYHGDLEIVRRGHYPKCETLGSDARGERGRPAEEVGSTAGKILVEEVQSGAWLDRHMGDMIVPYLVLAEGASEVSISRVTQHTRTNVKVAQWLTKTE